MSARTVAGLLLLALVTACSPNGSPTAGPETSPTAGPETSPTAGPETSPTARADGATAVSRPNLTAATGPDKYVALAQTLRRADVEVWFEADLVKAWLAGPQRFDTAVRRLGDLASQVDIAGFKVADEIGYNDGLTSPAKATAFLRDVRTELSRVAPGRRVLIDAVVLDLGCLPWRDNAGRDCAARARDRYPAASFDALTGYLRAGLVDRLDLSTGLLDEAAYEHRGTTRASAQQQAWQHVIDAGWDKLTVLQSRKALAAGGGYRGDAAQAEDDLAVYIDLPLAGGAHAVDVWTWRQDYRDEQVSLLGPHLAVNPLWTGLRARHEQGVQLFTHMTPSNLPTDPIGMAHECSVVAEVFDAVFVAAGTG